MRPAFKGERDMGTPCFAASAALLLTLPFLAPAGVSSAAVSYGSIAQTRISVSTRMTQGSGNDVTTVVVPDFSLFDESISALSTCPDGGVAEAHASLTTEGTQAALRLAGSINGRFDLGQCGGWSQSDSGTAGNSSVVRFTVDEATRAVVRVSLDTQSTGVAVPGTGLADFRSRARLLHIFNGTTVLLEEFNQANLVSVFDLEPAGIYEVRAEAEMPFLVGSHTYDATFDLEIDFVSARATAVPGLAGSAWWSLVGILGLAGSALAGRS